MAARKDGFTLLEMSMVLVIIALIIGAISIGRSLIRNSEIQSVSRDSAHFVGAIKAFQDKYSALPGDFSNASNIFSGVTSGNGDGLISGLEQFYAWQDLVLAGMIDGTYTGADVAGGGSFDRVPGTNVPASQVRGAGWGLVYVASTSGDLLYTAGDVLPGHVLWFGGVSTTGNDDEQNPVLSAEEAEQIDRKLDDGQPGLGKIVAQINGTGTACYASSSYSVTTGGLICSLVFKTGY